MATHNLGDYPHHPFAKNLRMLSYLLPSAPHYPALFYPESIERIRTGTPPEPTLSLLSLPVKPSLPRQSQPPTFDCDIPQPFYYGWLLSSIISTVLLGSITGGFGFVGFLVTVAMAVLQWFTYPDRQATYRRKRQHHERELKQFHQQVAQEQGQYRRHLEAYQQDYDRIERENQRLRSEHQQECAMLRTPAAIEEWRISQLNSLVLHPKPLEGRVDITQFDPRSYPEFESNSQFPGLLKNYFGDKIDSLRYLSGRIPAFCYVDEPVNLSIAIEINVPYTPRKYPNSGTNLKLLHCIGQDEPRLKIFQASDWFVLVFSERQVLESPRECCKVIAQLIDRLTGTKLVNTNFQRVADVRPDPQWTEAMARDMAKRQTRLKYARSYNYNFWANPVQVIIEPEEKQSTTNFHFSGVWENLDEVLMLSPIKNDSENSENSFFL
ncbi:hypothetical protein [[Phormidium] sp. ETS-05]|uniref:hypothetical protein n=1 Tax=[Phormidium] sp. ETS-05 TaxID=222819 RepID=UPI0018EF1D36|nr:hypothetical protein [[Phormidium] sp. ETS-05]